MRFSITRFAVTVAVLGLSQTTTTEAFQNVFVGSSRLRMQHESRPATGLKASSSPTNAAVVDQDGGSSEANDDDMFGQLLGSRRQLFQRTASMTAASLLVPFLVAPTPALAAASKSVGNLDDLPPDGKKSYLQYRIQLQIFADFFIYDLQTLVEDTDEWGEVGQLFRVNNNRGQGQPSRIEREFTNPIRILGLSLPPEYADPMVDSQYKFERAMGTISKATSGYRRDLPVEVDKNAIVIAKQGWEDGRVAINEIFTVINEATGLNELKLIPPAGPNQQSQYGRSIRRYNDLVKKTKLCQNRGGPALSQAWGGLMVSGYLQDSCGIPDLEEYFFQ